MVDNVSRRSVLKGVGAGMAAAATANAAQAETLSGGEYLVGVNGRGSAREVEGMATNHRKTIDMGKVRQVVHADLPAQAAQSIQAAANGEATGPAAECTGVESTVLTGEVEPGGQWTGSYRPSMTSCDLTFDLSASSSADLDLYVTMDGRSPTPSDFDRRATAAGSDESITLSSESLPDNGSVGLLVESYSGGGSFELEIEEAGGLPGNVAYIEENGEMQALAQDLPWGIDRVDADKLHSSGSTGAGADIAIIDTGIDSDHEDLQANLGKGKAFAECSSSCTEPWDDDGGHGTHCAGIADAADNSTGVVGVSTEATLHAVKVLSGDGGGSFSDVADGIRYVADQGWDVGSLSLGASSGSSTVKDACTYAYDNGVLLVAAAGNSGPCSDCVGYPAAYEECIAVSSTNNSDGLSYFSSTGPEVEIAAPGSDIRSSVPESSYGTKSGTSMACPHVSGAGGQLMANGLTHKEARQRLKSTAEDLGLPSNEQGSGLLDAEAAVGGGGGGGGDEEFYVTTGSASSVSDTTATLNGSLDNLGGAASATVYFEYRQTGSTSWTATSSQTLSSTGSFSESISGLSSGTDYEFRAVGEAGDGDSDTGATSSFSTDSGGFCFITTATARHGETLDSLRRFRDDSMAATPVGRGLVGLYYRISPPIADTLKRHPNSRTAKAVRKLVRTCASLSDRQAETDSRAESASIGVALTMLYMVGIVAGAAGHAGISALEQFDRD